MCIRDSAHAPRARFAGHLRFCAAHAWEPPPARPMAAPLELREHAGRPLAILASSQADAREIALMLQRCGFAGVCVLKY